VFFSFIAYSTPLPLSRQLSVSEDEVNLVFNNATQKVIKDAFKHSPLHICCRLLHAGEFTSLLHVGVEVIDFFTLICKCNSFLHVGVEARDEANTGLQDLSDQGAAPSGGGG
jgi:hypothetical protein